MAAISFLVVVVGLTFAFPSKQANFFRPLLRSSSTKWNHSRIQCRFLPDIFTRMVYQIIEGTSSDFFSCYGTRHEDEVVAWLLNADGKGRPKTSTYERRQKSDPFGDARPATRSLARWLDSVTHIGL